MAGRFAVWAQVLEAGARRWERVAESLWESSDDLSRAGDFCADEGGLAERLWSVADECAEGARAAQGWADHLRLLLTDVAEVETDVVRDLLLVGRRLW